MTNDELTMEYRGPPLPTRFIPGTPTDYVIYIQSLGNKAQLKVVDGIFCWIVTEEDGQQAIHHPIEAKPND